MDFQVPIQVMEYPTPMAIQPFGAQYMQPNTMQPPSGYYHTAMNQTGYTPPAAMHYGPIQPASIIPSAPLSGGIPTAYQPVQPTNSFTTAASSAAMPPALTVPAMPTAPTSTSPPATTNIPPTLTTDQSANPNGMQPKSMNLTNRVANAIAKIQEAIEKTAVGPEPVENYNNPTVAAFRKAEVDSLNRIRSQVFSQESPSVLKILKLDQVSPPLTTLCLNASLSILAQKYANLMASLKESGHFVGGTSPDQRYKDQMSTFIGENVAEVDEIKDADVTKMAQLNSEKSSGLLKEDKGFPDKGHYVNMVNPQAKSVGIGVWWADKPDGFRYWYSVQLFSTQPC